MKVDEGKGYWVEGTYQHIPAMDIYSYILHDPDCEKHNYIQGIYAIYRVIIYGEIASLHLYDPTGEYEEPLELVASEDSNDHKHIWLVDNETDGEVMLEWKEHPETGTTGTECDIKAIYEGIVKPALCLEDRFPED